MLATLSAGATALEQRAMQSFVPPGKAPGPKGPRVFMDYDQQELDWAYDQAPWAPNAAEIARRNAQKSAAAL
jgi:arylformamidase